MKAKQAVTLMLLTVALFTVVTSAVAASQAGGAGEPEGEHGLESGSLLAWFALFTGAGSLALAIAMSLLLSRVLARGGQFDWDALQTVSLRMPDPVEELETQRHRPDGSN